MIIIDYWKSSKARKTFFLILGGYLFLNVAIGVVGNQVLPKEGYCFDDPKVEQPILDTTYKACADLLI